MGIDIVKGYKKPEEGSGSSGLGTIGAIALGVPGAVFGGPAGASAGMQAGSTIGGLAEKSQGGTKKSDPTAGAVSLAGAGASLAGAASKSPTSQDPMAGANDSASRISATQQAGAMSDSISKYPDQQNAIKRRMGTYVG